MAAAKMTEEEAFAMLRRRAQDARSRLAVLAQGILDHGADHKPPPSATTANAADQRRRKDD